MRSRGLRSDVENVDDVIIDMLKQGFVSEAEILVEAATATGMSSDTQAQQTRFFSSALSRSGGDVDETTLTLDPKRRVMSFVADGMSVIKFPSFLEKFLKTLNRVGNTRYSLGKVRRGRHTVVEINIGK